ncbi:hypothetical protein UFOVP328_47 [uncultured Caudovirales phage]|uniref:Uncharacterized protein n=1 Tax=uncultured Caudovirales phage TaxID=2100421 RepID=A0A6J5LV42_9CAUD|nr:hypothetical protein UFOVP328_47 [uncultured Caudovirales phage]
MSSNINPNNIDGTYPVAGQDNNSQGFRDNFTNIKTNFQYASDEISELQSKALLKSALTGTVLDNNMLGSLIYNATIADFGATRLALGTVSGSQTINYALGHFQTLTTSGSVSLAFTNFPTAGIAGVVSVQVTVASTAHTLTLPSAVSVNNSGIQGLNPSTNVITFAAVGTYTFQFISSDGGTTITVNEVNKRLEPFNNTSEDLAASGAANLAVATSYFSTSASETATLAAGVNGQVKTFAMFADSGDMVITVTNAGWKSSGTGTITFDTIGDACTLQYINGKWFCIGNNGAVFA